MMFSFNACRSVLFFLSLSLGGAFSRSLLQEPDVAKESKVNIGTAGNYVILAKSGISTVPDSGIIGNIGVSPIAGEAMTGFAFANVSSPDEDYLRSVQLAGKAYAANFAPPIPAQLSTAVYDMMVAYTDAAGRPSPDAARHDLGGGTLGGVFGGAEAKLTPGVYTFGSDVYIAGEIFFHGTGTDAGQGDTDIFIIQMTGNLVQAANYKVVLTNGALAENIFWQIAGHVKVGAGAHMEGILLVKTDVLFKTGASLNGRVLSQTACNLQKANIIQPSNQ